MNTITTVAYFKETCYVNNNDDIYIHTYSLSSSSSSSRLSIDIVLFVLLRDTSYRINNRYPGHNSHLLLLYKKETEKHNMYCCVKICFTSAVLLADCIEYNKHRTLYSPLTRASTVPHGRTSGTSTTDGMRWIQISLDNTIRRLSAKCNRLSALAFDW